MKITQLQFSIYKKKLDKLNAELPELEKEMQAARALGDLSENEEFHSAKNALSSAKLEANKLEEVLKSEVIDYDTSNIMTVGSIVKISSPCLEEDEIKMLGDSGDFLIEPVLNVNSELGKKVLGQVSGEFRVKDNIFHVEKVENPDFELFAESYKSEDQAIADLLGVM